MLIWAHPLYKHTEQILKYVHKRKKFLYSSHLLTYYVFIFLTANLLFSILFEVIFFLYVYISNSRVRILLSLYICVVFTLALAMLTSVSKFRIKSVPHQIPRHGFVVNLVTQHRELWPLDDNLRYPPFTSLCCLSDIFNTFTFNPFCLDAQMSDLEYISTVSLHVYNVYYPIIHSN